VSSSASSSDRLPYARSIWVILAGLATLLIALTTLQWGVNGSQSPYATDVGEIQNALPRWGTIHFTGYPLYTFLGSAFVTLTRVFGLEPAGGTSLYSALWAAVAAGLMVVLAAQFDVPTPLGALGAVIASLALSSWIDASLAEVHTMTMALTLGSLILGIRFSRSGTRADLLWLALVFTQGSAHQRAVLFMVPALALLCLPHWRLLWQNTLALVGLALLAFATYLYLPIRDWMGADWTFGQPGTWRGFWAMVLDTKADRIVATPDNIAVWLTRLRDTAALVLDDLPLPLAAAGLTGLLLPLTQRRTREVGALLLTVLAYHALLLVIWEGRVSDALLAVKLPEVYLMGLGLALWAALAWRWRRGTGWMAAATLVAAACWLYVTHRPTVLAITRDPAAETVIAAAERIASDDERPITLMALWGHDYWALRYAQTYRGGLRGMDIVDHNTHFERIVEDGQRLLTLEKTLYELSPEWWANRLGAAHLSAVAPGIIEIAPAPLIADELRPAPLLELGNGISVLAAHVISHSNQELAIHVTWHADRAPDHDHAVAVHLLRSNPPQGGEDILAQADRQHPVGGWSPTSRWVPGQIVADAYSLRIPDGAHPVGVRIGMYRALPDGGFENSEWLFLPIKGITP